MSRRARPTLRVLREDLSSEWNEPFVLRALEAGEISAVQPLSALPHPILQKAADSFGDDPSQDSFVGPIASVSSEVLLEIKHGQWRAGVWVDESCCWVVVAGLAKGDHKDRDDFYKRLERLEKAHSIPDVLPDDRDHALLKTERAGAVISAWQLRNQEQIVEVLSSVLDGGTGTLTIEFPRTDPSTRFATVNLTVTIVDEPDDCYEDVVVEIDFADRWKNSALVWPFTMQLLAAISPPEQGWDVGGGIYSNFLATGTLAKRLETLGALTLGHEIATTAPGTTAHYAHRRTLAERTVEGRATRALCGVYFVPRQDAESMDECPACAALYTEFPSR